MKAIEMIVDQQIKRWELEKKLPKEAESRPAKPGPVITISRQRGAGGSIVAERLAELTGFSHINREIIDQICRETGAQKRLVESLDESMRSNFQLWVDGIVQGRIIDTSDYLKTLVRIIGIVSHHGKAIIVGRGANFIVGDENGFHVRITADYEHRVKSIMSRWDLDRNRAEEEIEKTDQHRKKFIKSNFDRDINDPTAYDLMINSTYLDIDKIAGLILNSYPQKNYT